MSKRIDLTGKRFGRLVVIEYSHTKKIGKSFVPYWKCRCECGKEKIINGSSLKSGKTISCGEAVHKIGRYKTHGHSGERIYNIWCVMKQRCYDKNFEKYPYYGGRGVIVCDEWKNDFQVFYEWSLKNGYSDELSIDRIEVNGNYIPSNCRWVNDFVQANNKRNNILLEHDGESHTLSQWSRIMGVSYGALRRRVVDENWSAEDALTIPVKVGNNQTVREGRWNNLKLKKMELSFFKGCKHAVYEFGEKITTIKGMNRLGKTTIASGYFWCLADYDYGLTNNPSIFPDDVEECTPTVSLTFDCNGKEIEIAKIQKRTVKEKDGAKTISTTNTYKINGVPKTLRDFKAYLEDLGFSFDNFLVCSHPNVFTGQKQADMRKALFKMASEKSDYDIASMSAETADVAKLFVDYKFEEIEAMNKASKKKAAEQVAAIPNQIVGLEKAKVDIDVAEQELAKADLEREITEIDKKISNAGAAVSSLQGEEMQLQFAMSGIMQAMNRELHSKRRELDNAKDEARNLFSDVHNKIVVAVKQIEDNTEKISLAKKKRAELGEQYKAELVKTFDETPYLFNEGLWVFDENSTVCSMCGQTLPADKTEQLRAEFEDRKAKAKADAEKQIANAKERFMVQHNSDLEEIKANGFKQKNIIDTLTAENSSLQTNIEVWKKQEQEALGKQDELTKQLAELPEETDYSQNAEYANLKAKYEEVLANIERAKLSTDDELLAQFEEEKAELTAELEVAKKIIAQAENNIRIDEQISELQEKQRDYEQAKADAEKILYQLSLVSKRKNELLVEEINQHFGIVKWILFDYQKNGEYKEVCIPEIDGKRFGDSTNTGREIEAKLDICNSFQKFFGMYCPIFLDGAESINDEYIPAVDTQLILLTVTDDKELKVVV